MENSETIQAQRSEENSRARRRQFLLAGGATIAGLGLVALAEHPQKTKEPDKNLLEQLALFDDEEKECLAKFLIEFNRYQWRLTTSIADCFLKSLDMIRLSRERAEGQRKAKEQERRYRDGLPRDERIRYVLSKLENRDLSCYSWRLHEQALLMVRDGTPTPDVTWAETLEFCAGHVRERFEGCDKAFRTEVIDRYFRDILPGKRAEDEEREADQISTDKLLAAISGKTPEEINALAEQIIAVA